MYLWIIKSLLKNVNIQWSCFFQRVQSTPFLETSPYSSTAHVHRWSLRSLQEHKVTSPVYSSELSFIPLSGKMGTVHYSHVMSWSNSIVRNKCKGSDLVYLFRRRQRIAGYSKLLADGSLVKNCLVKKSQSLIPNISQKKHWCPVLWSRITELPA